LLLPTLAAQADPTAAVRDCLTSVVSNSAVQVGELTVSGTGDAIAVAGPLTLLGHAARATATFAAGRRLQAIEVAVPDGAISVASLDQLAGGGLAQLLATVPVGAAISLRRVGISLAADGSIGEVAVGVGTGVAWDLLPGASLQMQDVSAELAVANPRGARAVRGTLAGQASVAGIALSLRGTLATRREEIELAATVSGQTPTLRETIRSVGGNAAAATLDPLPTSLRDLSLRELTLAVRPFAKTATVSTTTTLGRLSLTATGASGGVQFAAAIAPPAGFKLGQIDSSLASLDAAEIDLAGLTLAVASHSGPFAPGVGGLAPATPLVKGLNLFARLDLRKLRVADLLKVEALDLRALIPFPNPLSLVLQAAIQADIDLGGGARFREVMFELRPSPQRFKLGLLGKVDLQVDRQTLRMLGEMAVEPLTQTVAVTMALDPAQGEWREPFGLRGVGVMKLAASLGATFGAGIPLPTVGLQGGLRLGSGPDPVTGNGVVVLNPRDPMHSMVALDLQNIALPRLIALADAGAADQIRRSPLGNALDKLELRNVSIRIVPDDLDFAGTRFERGYRFAGDFNVLGATARGLFELDYTRGLSALATVSTIRLGSALELTGAGGQGDPLVKLDLRTDRQEFLINGRIILLKDLLGAGRHFFTSETDLQVLPTGFSLYAQGSVLGVLATEVQCTAQGSLANQSADFFLRAKMQQTALAELREKARQEIDKATRDHVRQINEAKAKVATAQADVNRLDRDIAATRRRVGERQARDLAAMRAHADRDSREARAEYDRIGRLINEKHAAIADAKSWSFPKSIGMPATVAALGTEIGWLETRRNAHKLVMDTIGSNLVKGLAKLGDNFPKELSSELGPMIAGQKIAQGSLLAAQGVLDGYKHVVKGTMGAAKWIADNGLGNVIDLNLMQFETRLSTQRDSYVQLGFRGRFCGSNFTTGMRLNLSDPAAMAADIAKALIEGKLPNQGVTDFGLTARAPTTLSRPRALPALTQAELLARAGAATAVATTPPAPPAKPATPLTPQPRPAPAEAGTRRPRPAPPVAGPTPDLAGTWVDLNRCEITITQQANVVSVTMVTAAGQRWWTTAQGTLSGSVIGRMQHMKDGKVTDTVRGTVAADGRTIQWSNGTSWTKR
jgi:hypothetical protein